ncbi:hypothetical protein GSY71_18030 [Pusillimonas sp. TS35]|nr:hypothetical protein [Pusillimonas sp. TS35]
MSQSIWRSAINAAAGFNAKMNRRLIVVLGMHRSGTSAITRALQAMGVDLGNRLMKPVEHINAKGFWEDDDITELNERILHSLGMRWDSLQPFTDQHIDIIRENGLYTEAVDLIEAKTGKSAVYGFKDPRVAKLLPLWQAIFQSCGLTPSFLITIRNPLSVAQSLKKRDCFNPIKSYLLWLDHVLTSLELSRSHQRALVDYDQLMRDPKAALQQIAADLQLATDVTEVDAYVQNFIDEGLRHSTFSAEDIKDESNCPALIYDVYSTLLNANTQSLNSVEIDQRVQRWLSEFQRLAPVLSLLDTLQAQVLDFQRTVNELRSNADNCDEKIAEYNTKIVEHDAQIKALASEIALRDQLLSKTSEELQMVTNSNSWRITAPLRSAGNRARRLVRATRVAKGLAKQYGGIANATKKAYQIFKAEGIHGLQIRLNKPIVIEAEKASFTSRSIESELSIVPYYINFDSESTFKETLIGKSIAIHCHIPRAADINQLVARLNNIPETYFLFVSVVEHDTNQLLEIFHNRISNAQQICIETVPERAGVFGSLIAQYGPRLTKFDLVGNITLATDSHPAFRAYTLTLDNLFPSLTSEQARITHMLSRLGTDSKFIFSEDYLLDLTDRSAWGQAHSVSKELLERILTLSIHDYPKTAYPIIPAFWSTSNAIKTLLKSQLKLDDFTGAMSDEYHNALHRSLLFFTKQVNGICLRIHKYDSITDYRYYEDQYDYSDKVAGSDIKVLAYYLPQFHPTPENDEWHGKGFTEWTKVRAANPLFEGHFQQHIPHESLGYYDLESPAALRIQADMMKKSGVHGQVFYHYWFTGKLILEKPAQMLLATPDIAMPYCFCWANENWTRRWDGNEKEILLGQDYSTADAQSFIRYLIPFFQDPRYIRVDDRPILLIYRPSSIPNPTAYLSIWEEECNRVGIPKPYVVAVLTRGATDPYDFNMDAGTERVLHDWTNGGVVDIKPSLHTYYPLTGSVLPYREVAEFYKNQEEPKRFTYFRSLVPTWDNTARYGQGALALHGSTPFEFQKWLETSITYTRKHLPIDRRFIFVNAWNEWAEGAHLEPDTRFGYSYLNSVGRAIAGIKYAGQPSNPKPLPAHLSVHIEFADDTLRQLEADEQSRLKFLQCLKASTIFQGSFDISSNLLHTDEILHKTTYVASVTERPDILIKIRGVSLFDANALEQLLETAYNSGSTVVPNTYSRYIAVPTEKGTLLPHEASIAPVLVCLGTDRQIGRHRHVVLDHKVHCFPILQDDANSQPLPSVTTIVRFHKNADARFLKNALYSLAAMKGCKVTPYIAAQDLSTDQKTELKDLVSTIPFSHGVEPIIRHFNSINGNGDLRSKMLNESLLSVQTRYAAILDYDDLLFPDAYDWLIQRTVLTGKAVAFGRVFSSEYDSQRQTILSRSRSFEYGYSYKDFISHNHAPIHSFLVDLDRVSLAQIEYFEDQRYMEDYLLTLQIFTESNSDWSSLAENFYLGDYIHSIDRAHTLAINDSSQRNLLRMKPEYKICEQRIQLFRKKIPS